MSLLNAAFYDSLEQ